MESCVFIKYKQDLIEELKYCSERVVSAKSSEENQFFYNRFNEIKDEIEFCTKCIINSANIEDVAELGYD